MKNNQAELNNDNPTSNAPEATAATDEGLLTFGGHLEVLRQMLWRIIGVTALLAIVVFCLKDTIFPLLLAPSEWDFVTYRGIELLILIVAAIITPPDLMTLLLVSLPLYLLYEVSIRVVRWTTKK